MGQLTLWTPEKIRNVRSCHMIMYPLIQVDRAYILCGWVLHIAWWSGQVALPSPPTASLPCPHLREVHCPFVPTVSSSVTHLV